MNYFLNKEGMETKLNIWAKSHDARLLLFCFGNSAARAWHEENPNLANPKDERREKRDDHPIDERHWHDIEELIENLDD